MHTIKFTIERLTTLAKEMATYFGDGSDVMEEARSLLSDPLWIRANLNAFSDSHVAKILEEQGVRGCIEVCDQNDDVRGLVTDFLVQRMGDSRTRL